MLTKPLVPYDFCSCVPISLQDCENFADGSFAALEKTIARLYHCCSAGCWAKHDRRLCPRCQIQVGTLAQSHYTETGH